MLICKLHIIRKLLFNNIPTNRVDNSIERYGDKLPIQRTSSLPSVCGNAYFISLAEKWEQKISFVIFFILILCWESEVVIICFRVRKGPLEVDKKFYKYSKTFKIRKTWLGTFQNFRLFTFLKFKNKKTVNSFLIFFYFNSLRSM